MPAGGQAQRLSMEFRLACCLERSMNPLVPLHESLAHFAFVGGKNNPQSKDTKAGGNGKPPAFRSQIRLAQKRGCMALLDPVDASHHRAPGNISITVRRASA